MADATLTTGKSELIFDPDGEVALILLRSAENPSSIGSKKRPREESDDADEEDDDFDVVDRAAENTLRPAQVRMVVSSKHMTLASPVFKVMLLGPFKEGRELAVNGKIEVTLPDDSVEAMAIILCIIHGDMDLVPQIISHNLLTDIAVLVDKYQLFKIASAFCQTWMNNLEPPEDFESVDTPDIPRWIAISWIFKDATMFELSTLGAILTAQASFGQSTEYLLLPIPEKVTDAVRSTRSGFMKSAVGKFNDLIFKYEDSSREPQCRRQDGKANHCDELVFGSIARLGKNMKLWPSADCCPVTSIQDTYSTFSRAEAPTLCQYAPPGGSPHPIYFGTRRLCWSLNNGRRKIVGLNLEKFK